MRLSTDPNDPGYVNYLKAKNGIKVLLDGVELSGVFTADEEKRFVIQAIFDQDGNYQLNKDKTEVLQQTLYGTVVVLFN